ncbi:MAG: ribonuclease HIII [Lentisphaerae bacterium]|nr:ribonuclease HIII [Lentisphaerota bacterium]
MSIKKTSFTYILNADQQLSLKALLAEGNFKPVSVPHTSIAAEGNDCRINLYNSGKCLIQGRGAEEFVLYYLEPMVLGSVGLGYEDILNPVTVEPHMGIDESGKGDFFGPLVAAAAYVNQPLARTMSEIGVKDCKEMSDKQVLAVGARLRDLLGHNRYALVTIGAEAYNRLYAKFRNVNSLLAWAHARCIENLLNTIPDCPRAVADQFGSEVVIKRALMKKGRSIVLEQRHKAESDIAVAAASVLAREAFLRSLLRTGHDLDITIPKGASEQVRNVAIDLVKRQGPASLIKLAKCHFRTTDAVLAACGKSRSDLPADGQVVSKPYEGRRSGTKTATAESSDAKGTETAKKPAAKSTKAPAAKKTAAKSTKASTAKSAKTEKQP